MQRRNQGRHLSWQGQLLLRTQHKAEQLDDKPHVRTQCTIQLMLAEWVVVIVAAQTDQQVYKSDKYNAHSVTVSVFKI